MSSKPVAASLFLRPLVLQVKQASAGGSRSRARVRRTRQRGRRRTAIWVCGFNSIVVYLFVIRDTAMLSKVGGWWLVIEEVRQLFIRFSLHSKYCHEIKWSTYIHIIQAKEWNPKENVRMWWMSKQMKICHLQIQTSCPSLMAWLGVLNRFIGRQPGKWLVKWDTKCQMGHKFDRKYFRCFFLPFALSSPTAASFVPTKGITHSYRTSLNKFFKHECVIQNFNIFNSKIYMI